MSSLIGALLDRVPRRTPTVEDRTALPFSSPARGLAAYQRTPALSTRVMENVGTVYAIVSKTAESVAAVNWHLYRKSTDNRRRYAHDGMDDRREVTGGHPALKVWENPNPHMTQRHIVESFTQYMLLTGESWWHLPTTAPSLGPYEIWPMRPDRVAVVEDPDLYISGFEYMARDGQRIHLEPREVIFSRRPNPYDEYRGIGPIQSILAKADSVRYSDQWNLSYFLNSAEPGGILKVNADLSDREIERLRTRWEESLQGPHNAHRMAILDAEESEWIQNASTQRDMQFVELQTLNAEKIREAFAFPKFMLGTTEDANRASAQAAEYIYARYTLIPILERIKQALNSQFLPLFGASGAGVEFDYDSPVPSDEEAENASLTTRSAAAMALIGAGFYAPEVREALGLPEFSYGEPNADKDRELVIKVLTGAPTLAPQLLPLLGIDVPAAPVADNVVTPSPDDTDGVVPAREAAGTETGVADIDTVSAILNAQRWVVVTQDDDNRCGPCAANDGKLYKNREQAYKDYPNGTSYVNCVGEEYGNDCRCKVVKRGKAGNDTDEEVNGG